MTTLAEFQEKRNKNSLRGKAEVFLLRFEAELDPDLAMQQSGLTAREIMRLLEPLCGDYWPEFEERFFGCFLTLWFKVFSATTKDALSRSYKNRQRTANRKLMLAMLDEFKGKLLPMARVELEAGEDGKHPARLISIDQVKKGNGGFDQYKRKKLAGSSESD